ncbi:hypothetical protein A2U01_0114477, partial [Trifolium medium]|nr:hypothetical protein [Trifolium medium]
GKSVRRAACVVFLPVLLMVALRTGLVCAARRPLNEG